MRKSSQRSNCPISCSLEIWGDKWSLLIIRDLMFANKNTYSDFLQADEKISTNILAARLQTLEQEEIIQKCEHPKSRAKVWYQLTPKGIALMPILIEIHLWTAQFSDVPAELQQALNSVKADKSGFIQAHTEKLLSIYQSNQQHA